MRDPIAHARSGAADSRLAAVLEAATAPAERPVPGEQEALLAFRAEFADAQAAPSTQAMAPLLPSDPTRRFMKSRTTKLVAVGAISAFSLLGGGYAAATTDALPESASDAARAALAAVGIDGPAEQAADSATTHTKSPTGSENSAGSGADDASTDAADPAANDHGQLASSTAKGDYASGKERGEAVSSVASSKSTENRQDDAAATTAGDASQDASVEGRATATEKSGGASDLGAGNADAERP